eukprot:1278328-Prorocentrum_lima.AAC.1
MEEGKAHGGLGGPGQNGETGKDTFGAGALPTHATGSRAELGRTENPPMRYADRAERTRRGGRGRG